MSTHAKRALKDWVDQALRQGWRVKIDGRCHYRFFPTDTSIPPLTIPASPREGRRSFDNSRAALRRAGLRIS